jgi:AmmeMemoRadiSam system protein A
VVTTSELLDHNQGRILIELARKTIAHRVGEGELPAVPADPAFMRRAATFVTLKIAGKLRGCIGNLEPAGALWEGIRDNAVHAALNDNRFSPLRLEELSRLELDISILSNPAPLEYDDAEDLVAKLHPGIDGVILRDGIKSATFLPQVWQQLPLPENFLGQLCRKAGLPTEIWREKQLDIKTYQVQCFEEEKE